MMIATVKSSFFEQGTKLCGQSSRQSCHESMKDVEWKRTQAMAASSTVQNLWDGGRVCGHDLKDPADMWKTMAKQYEGKHE